MLPSGIEPRAVLGVATISYSELATVAACEAKWAWTYGSDRERPAPTGAMRLGTEVHRLLGLWWTGGAWEDTEDETALWLMQRYAKHYAPSTMHLRMEALEAPLVATFPWGVPFLGFADGLLWDEAAQLLWIYEAKTAKDSASALRYLVQSPQLPLYVWAARAMGFDVAGVCLDVLRTHKPVKKEMALADSFERRWLTYDFTQLSATLNEAKRATQLISDLRHGSAPLRNVGPSCSWCSAVVPCHGLELELEIEDED